MYNLYIPYTNEDGVLAVLLISRKSVKSIVETIYCKGDNGSFMGKIIENNPKCMLTHINSKGESFSNPFILHRVRDDPQWVEDCMKF